MKRGDQVPVTENRLLPAQLSATGPEDSQQQPLPALREPERLGLIPHKGLKLEVCLRVPQLPQDRRASSARVIEPRWPR